MFPRFDQRSLLQQIAEAQTTTFLVKDLDHRFLMVNQHFADVVQLRVEDIIGKNDLEIGIPEHMVLGDETSGFPGFWAMDDQAIASGVSQSSAENRISYRDGMHHDANTTRTPLCDENNQVVALLVQSQDLSDLRTLQNTLQESLNVREDQLTVINDLMTKMMMFQELDPLLQHIAEIMIEYTLADNALILMVNDTQEYMQVVASAGSQSKQNIGQRRQRGKGFAGLAWSTGKTQYISNSESNPLTKGFWPSGTQLLAVPLIVDKGVIGVAVLGAPNDFADFRTSSGLVGSLANLAGIAIASAESQELSKQELKRTRALNEISKHIAECKERDELLTSVSKTLMDAMDVTRTSCYLAHEEGSLCSFASWHRIDGIVQMAKPMPDELLRETIVYWSLRNNEFAQVARESEDLRESSRIHELRRELEIGATMCMPIASKQRVIGVLLVYRNQISRDFDENEINLFINIVGQLSNAMYSNELSVALEFQAYHDSLTKLPNRRCFEQALQTELHRDGRRLSAIMFLDLDGFKAVNDTLGHGVGDELLCHIATRLGSRIQSDDILARIGGDEFAVIARDLSSSEQAIDIATRLTDALTSTFDINGAKLKIGASIGISFYPDDGHTAHELLRNADEAMYRAKSDCRGTIVCFSQSMADDSRKRVNLEFELREAIEQQQFELYFQTSG